jgi:hypothetical protein
MKKTIYGVYWGLAWVVFAGMVLQFFLAGIGVFRAASLGPHRTLGDLLIYASVVLLILAVGLILSGNLDRGEVVGAVLLVVLLILQYFLASDFLQDDAPVISALHPVNGLLLVLVSYALARGQGLP